ncbi:FMN-binding protein [bacterium]|nr:FMN-binding protein [bacterium]
MDRHFTFRTGILGMVLVSGIGFPPVLNAKVFRTLPEVMSEELKGHPDAEWKAESIYLKPEEVRQIESKAQVKAESALVVRQVLRAKSGKALETIYAETHKVRTHPETVMVVVGPDSKIIRCEVLSFDEPLEYLPKQNWYETFRGRALDQELNLKSKIPLVTGASLSARAMLEASRRILATHETLQKRGVNP